MEIIPPEGHIILSEGRLMRPEGGIISIGLKVGVL